MKKGIFLQIHDDVTEDVSFCKLLSLVIILTSLKPGPTSQKRAADGWPLQRFLSKLEMELELIWHIMHPELDGQASYHLSLFLTCLNKIMSLI